MADDYATHYPILAAALSAAHGMVLEAGCGEGSTPMLHYMCKDRRALLTLDSDLAWLSKFTAYRKDGAHHLEHVQDWETHDLLGDAIFGVAFVDCAPGGARAGLIRRLVNRATLIVCHDSERDYASGADYGYDDLKSLFKHVSEFRRWRPYTLVLSNFQPFEIEECDRVWQPNPAQQAYYQEKGIKG